MTNTKGAALTAVVVLLAAPAAALAKPADFGPAPVAEAYAAAPNGPLAAQEISAWWLRFDDPVLNRLVETALAQNLDVAQAGARLDQARAAARLSRAERLPASQVTGEAAAQRQSLESSDGLSARGAPGYDRNQESYEVYAGAVWELDLFGGLRAAGRAARADAAAAQAGRDGARLAVAAETADAYVQLREAQRRLDLARSRIGWSRQFAELAAARFEAGAAARSDRDQAEAQLAGAEAVAPLLEAAVVAQTARLNVLLGAAPGTYDALLAPAGPIPQARTPQTAGAPPTCCAAART